MGKKVDEVKTVAFDPGFGGIKVYSTSGSTILRSSVASNGAKRVAKVEGLKSARRPLMVETAAGSFYVGLGAHDAGRPVENLDFDRLTGSPEMLALFLAVMAKHGVSGRTKLIVGLPVASLMGDGATETQKAVRGFLQGGHKWTVDGVSHELEVESVAITSQPVGAMFDYLLTDDGMMTADRKAIFKKELGILGIGMNTVDLLVVRGGAPVQRFTAGETAGVRRLLELSNRDGLYSLSEMDEQLRKGLLDTTESMNVWRREVMGVVEKTWSKNFARFERVICVGGGAKLLRGALMDKFGQRIFVADDPVISTARGLYKFTVMKDRKEN